MRSGPADSGEKHKASTPISCPICRGPARFLYQVGDFFYEVTDYRAELFRCRDCRSVFQAPIPDRETIAGFYPGGYWRESDGSSLVTRLQQRYIRWMLQWDLMKWFQRLGLAPNTRFLDIGCGRGDWLALIRDRGYRVRGLEADPRAVAFARERFGLSVDRVEISEWKPEPETQEAVSFFHLLEHLQDPASFLARCHRALVPGGRILFRIPNIGSWQSRLFGKRWKGLEMPRHIIMVHPDRVGALLAEHGFEVRHRSTWSLRDGPPALASTLFPFGEPTRQEILGKPNLFGVLLYLAMNWVLTPLEVLAALCGKGAMLTVIAVKK